ncbi:transposase [Rhizobium sp. P28RR-XV]|uniref:IS66 family transposase n=1 Tax=Rhizobium sp. P28RR-XV TaxID=2726737 RepID=UPI0028AE65D0|nr:transposase [Rhizobium sp. P28RR-XV]
MLGPRGTAVTEVDAGQGEKGSIGHAGSRSRLAILQGVEGLEAEAFPAGNSGLPTTVDRIFTLRTGYDVLNALLVRLHRRKAELLRVLERLEIPLHTNASENDLRSFVSKRKISRGTMSRDGRVARDTVLGLIKTCQKLGVSFYHYLGDRLGIRGYHRAIASKSSRSTSLSAGKYERRLVTRTVLIETMSTIGR